MDTKILKSDSARSAVPLIGKGDKFKNATPTQGPASIRITPLPPSAAPSTLTNSFQSEQKIKAWLALPEKREQLEIAKQKKLSDRAKISGAPTSQEKKEICTGNRLQVCTGATSVVLLAASLVLFSLARQPLNKEDIPSAEPILHVFNEINTNCDKVEFWFRSNSGDSTTQTLCSQLNTVYASINNDVKFAPNDPLVVPCFEAAWFENSNVYISVFLVTTMLLLYVCWNRSRL